MRLYIVTAAEKQHQHAIHKIHIMRHVPSASQRKYCKHSTDKHLYSSRALLGSVFYMYVPYSVRSLGASLVNAWIAEHAMDQLNFNAKLLLLLLLH